MKYSLIEGDCIEVMTGFDPCSIDAIVCDPPYGIGFMGKQWDCAVPGDDFAAAALRVLKPGGHLIAFAACRTVHRLMVNLEDAQFELRDLISWLQWQGFPKSLDVSKAIDKAAGVEREVIGKSKRHGGGKLSGASFQVSPVIPDLTAPSTPEAKRWSGWGTALKPAQEPAVLARKPLEGTVADNVLKWGTGGLNIDGCRIPYGDPAWPGPSGDWAYPNGPGGNTWSVNAPPDNSRSEPVKANDLGRWPANIYHCAKPSRSEREKGCEELRGRFREDVTGRKAGSAGQNHARSGMTRTGEVKNSHPTVKPTALMAWLCTLVGGQKGSIILDPFMGSGSTGIGALSGGFNFIGIEKDPEYLEIARARIRDTSPMFDQEVPIEGSYRGKFRSN